MVGMDDFMQNGKLDDGLDAMINPEELKEKIKNAVAGNKIGEHTFKRKDGKEYKLTFECKNGKMLGVIQAV